MLDRQKLAPSGTKSPETAAKIDRVGGELEMARLASLFIRNNDFTQTRESLLNLLQVNRCRDIDEECGYPKGFIPARYFKDLFRRNSAANRVVRVRPDQCWSEPPELYEVEGSATTPFEDAWSAFLEKYQPWKVLHTLDVVSGIGRFGLLLIGLDDGLDLSKPVAGFNDDLGRLAGRPRSKLTVTYLRCFDETQVDVFETERRTWHPRYGLPVSYTIRFSDIDLDREGDGYAGIEDSDDDTDSIETQVHWTRCIHFHDLALTSPVYGTPRQECVLNDLLDFKKVKGGASEGMWAGGFPGIAVETQPGKEDLEFDVAAVNDTIRKYLNRMSRGLALENMTAKTLAPNVANPKDHVQMLLDSICLGSDVPIVIFLGAMAGQLASEMTLQQWNRNMGGRQKTLLIPTLIKPFVNRLIQFQVLPRPKVLLSNWTDFESITEAQRADVSLKRTQALLQYVTSGAEKVMPLNWFLSKVMGFSDKETAQIIVDVKANKTFYTKDLWSAQAGLTPNSSGTNPAKKTGTAGNTNAQGRPKPKTR